MKNLFGDIALTLKNHNFHLLAIGLAVAVAYLVFFENMFVEFDREKLEEKIVEVEREVNLVADGIRYDAIHLTKAEWEGNRAYLDDKVKAGIETIDQEYAIYAGLFKFKGSDLVALSDSYQSYAVPFDPFADGEFYGLVMSHFGVYGSFAYDTKFDGAGTGKHLHDVALRYRWVPVVDGVDDPYLIVIGVTEDSIKTKTRGWLVIGVVAFGAYVVWVTFAFVFYRHREKRGKPARGGRKK